MSVCVVPEVQLLPVFVWKNYGKCSLTSLMLRSLVSPNAGWAFMVAHFQYYDMGPDQCEINNTVSNICQDQAENVTLWWVHENILKYAISWILRLIIWCTHWSALYANVTFFCRRCLKGFLRSRVHFFLHQLTDSKCFRLNICKTPIACCFRFGPLSVSLFLQMRSSLNLPE